MTESLPAFEGLIGESLQAASTTAARASLVWIFMDRSFKPSARVVAEPGPPV
jgi:hypothetical protein